jgi:hypothetical protein
MPRRPQLGYFFPVHRPGHGLPWPERPIDPGWGVEEGELPEVEPPEPGEPGHPLPPNPPGIWPPLDGAGPSHPIFPVEPDDGPWEPGEIWPPIRPPGGGRLPTAPGQPLPKQLFWALVHLTGYGFRWVVVDLNAVHRPTPPAGGIVGRPPERPGPGVPQR